jgi:hypothetical protein
VNGLVSRCTAGFADGAWNKAGLLLVYSSRILDLFIEVPHLCLIPAGLDCRSEEELDDKIADMERSIQHDGLSLREEKMMVQNISKLKSQRDKIREFQGQQDSLSQWEAEAKKIKAVIDEVSVWRCVVGATSFLPAKVQYRVWQECLLDCLGSFKSMM